MQDSVNLLLQSKHLRALRCLIAALRQIKPSALHKPHAHTSAAAGAKIQFQRTAGQILRHLWTDLNVAEMRLRNHVEINAAENTGKPEEILIFAPASDRPLENLHRQLILPVLKVRRQFKFGRCKRVLTVSDICSVQPECHAALRSLERDKHTLSQKGLRQCEIFHITCDRIELRRHPVRPDVFPSIPRILRVRILRTVIAFHLDMCRHADVIPSPAVVFRLFKSMDRLLIVSRIVEFP